MLIGEDEETGAEDLSDRDDGNGNAMLLPIIFTM